MPAAEFPVRIDMSDKPVIPDAEETQDDTEQKKKSHSIPASSANLDTGRQATQCTPGTGVQARESRMPSTENSLYTPL